MTFSSQRKMQIPCTKCTKPVSVLLWAELYKFSKLLLFEWPLFIICQYILFGEIKMGKLGRVSDDENCAIPKKRHPHLNKILVCTELAIRTFSV